MGRPKETKRVYIHTSLSQPTYDRMEDHLCDDEGRIPPGQMRDFIEECVELYFQQQDQQIAFKC